MIPSCSNNDFSLLLQQKPSLPEKTFESITNQKQSSSSHNNILSHTINSAFSRPGNIHFNHVKHAPHSRKPSLSLTSTGVVPHLSQTFPSNQHYSSMPILPASVHPDNIGGLHTPQQIPPLRFPDTPFSFVPSSSPESPFYNTSQRFIISDITEPSVRTQFYPEHTTRASPSVRGALGEKLRQRKCILHHMNKEYERKQRLKRTLNRIHQREKETKTQQTS